MTFKIGDKILCNFAWERNAYTIENISGEVITLKGIPGYYHMKNFTLLTVTTSLERQKEYGSF